MSLHIIPFHLFFLKHQVQSDYSSLIYTYFIFLKILKNVFLRSLGSKFKSLMKKSFCILSSYIVSVPHAVLASKTNIFLFCHIWKPTYTRGSGLGAHPEVPQHLRASHSPRTVTPSERLFILLLCELQSGSEEHGMLTVMCYRILGISCSTLDSNKKVLVLSKFRFSSYTQSSSKNCKCTFPLILGYLSVLPVHILSQRISDGKQDRKALSLGLRLCSERQLKIHLSETLK